MANGPTIHRKQLFGGLISAEEFHRRETWGNQRCTGCRGKPVVVEIRTALLVKDLPADVQAALRLDAAAELLEWKPFDTRHGKAVNVGRVFACSSCRKTAEQQAARGPSYALVYIDEGPFKDRPIVQVLA